MRRTIWSYVQLTSSNSKRFVCHENLALLLAHELDGVRRQEWRMFALLNRLDDERAHQLFVLLHVPLFIVIFWFLSRPIQPTYFWFQAVVKIGHWSTGDS